MAEATENAEDVYEGEVGPGRRKMPTDRRGITHKFKVFDHELGQVKGYLTVNRYTPDGDIGELFLQGVGKEGSTLDGWVQCTMQLLSVAVQYQAELPMLCRRMAHMNFAPRGRVDGHPEIPFCHSVPAYLAEYVAHQIGDPEFIQQIQKIREELTTQ